MLLLQLTYKICNLTDFTIRLEPYCHPPPKRFSSHSFLLCRSPSGDVLSRDRQQNEPKTPLRPRHKNILVFVCEQEQLHQNIRSPEMCYRYYPDLITHMTHQRSSFRPHSICFHIYPHQPMFPS